MSKSTSDEPAPPQEPAPAGPPNPNTYDRTLARQLVASLDEARRLYQEADVYAEKLHARLPLGTKIRLTDGRTIELVDNFAETNASWKSTCVRRYDVKIHDKPKSKFKARKPTNGKAPKSKAKANPKAQK